MEPRLLRWLEDTLRFRWLDGAVTTVGPGHTTGWRVLPLAMLAQLIGCTAVADLGNAAPIRTTTRQAVLIPAGFRHRIDLHRVKKAVSRWGHFSFVFMGSMDVLSLFQTPRVFDRRAGDEMGDINEELAELKKGATGKAFLAKIARRQELGLRLLRLILAPSRLKPDALRILDSAARVTPVVRYLEEHPGAQLDLPALAAMVHLSPSRFHHVFREATGQAPMKFVQNIRLDQARQLLASSDAKIADIATRCGFGDPFHFSRLFKSRVGLSPAAFRESMRLRHAFA